MQTKILYIKRMSDRSKIQDLAKSISDVALIEGGYIHCANEECFLRAKYPSCSPSRRIVNTKTFETLDTYTDHLCLFHLSWLVKCVYPTKAIEIPVGDLKWARKIASSPECVINKVFSGITFDLRSKKLIGANSLQVHMKEIDVSKMIKPIKSWISGRFENEICTSKKFKNRMLEGALTWNIPASFFDLCLRYQNKGNLKFKFGVYQFDLPVTQKFQAELSERFGIYHVKAFRKVIRFEDDDISIVHSANHAPYPQLDMSLCAPRPQNMVCEQVDFNSLFTSIRDTELVQEGDSGSLKSLNSMRIKTNNDLTALNISINKCGNEGRHVLTIPVKAIRALDVSINLRLFRDSMTIENALWDVYYSDKDQVLLLCSVDKRLSVILDCEFFKNKN